jgi:hypothetical protein
MGKEYSDLERIDTVNHANQSEFDDPNDQDQESEYQRSRHQSEVNQNLNFKNDIRKKASTMMHKLNRGEKMETPIESYAESRVSWQSGLQNSGVRSKVSSILSRKSGRRKTKKRVTFFDMQILPEEKEPEEKFIERVPQGSVKLNKEQREKLIEVLEGPAQEDEDIILTLNEDQVLDVVNLNVGRENLKIALNESQMQEIRSKSTNRLSIYPKNFFAMVEKNKLKGSRLTVYPGEFFEGLEQRPSMARKSIADTRQKAISVYPKDLFDLVEKAISSGDVTAYPQELFDLLKEFKDVDVHETTREKAKSLYPSEFMEMAEKQAERSRDRQKTIYPKELFELADQEKVNADRVSVYPKDLFNMLEKEARKRNISIYPGDFFRMLQEDYENIVELNPEQVEKVVKANSGQRSTQIVISPNQRKTLLAELKLHKEKEEEAKKEMNLGDDDEDMAVNEDILEPPTLKLDKDQVMDIFNQNCVMNGAEISLTASQMNLLEDEEEGDSVRETVIGGAYYDALMDSLVDDYGQRISLANLSVRDRKTVLSNLREKTFSVMVKGEKDETPQLIDEAYFDVDEDAIVNVRTNEVISIGTLNSGERVRVLSMITNKNNKPSPSVLYGNVYYDALVDELVDRNGKRHTLKKMSLLELKNLIVDQDCEKVNVVVQPNDTKVMVLEDVTYLPLDDCLVDAQNRKTILTDLNDEQRVLLMSALGDKKGTLLNEQDSKMRVRLSTKGGIIAVSNSISEHESKDFNVRIHVAEDSDLNDKHRDVEAIRNRKKTGYPGKRKMVEEEEEEDFPKVYLTKEENEELDPEDYEGREKVRNRKKTSNPNTSSKVKTMDQLFDENPNERYRGSMAMRKKNYTGGMRNKANTIHPKGRKLAKKQSVRIGGEEMIMFVDETGKKVVGNARKGKKISPKRLTTYRKKKSKRERNTILGRLTETDKEKMIEEEFLKNKRKSKATRKSKISAKKSIVMENIERNSKPSFVKKLIAGGDKEMITEKRHTLGGDKKRKSKFKGRTKAKTFMNKDRLNKHKSGESLLSESNEPIEEETKVVVEPETVDLREDEQEMELKKSLSPEEKLQKFEEMKKNSGVSEGGRRTFVHTRKSKRESPSRHRGKTFANKLIEEEITEEDPKPRDVLVHEYHDSRPVPDDKHSKSIIYKLIRRIQ